jgi:outer membrane immunogenic protein
MKKLLLGTMLLAIAGPASAADMKVKAPIAMHPIFIWSGYYIGGNGGWMSAQLATDITPFPSPAAFVNLLPQTLDPAPKGYFGGGTFGRNFQGGGVWVLGWESDIQSGISGSVTESPIIQNNGTPFPGAFPGNNITINRKLDWWTTQRIRLGVTVIDPRVMVYATAGVAGGHFTDSANTNFRPVGTVNYASSVSEGRYGLAAGGGIEWAVTDIVSLKGEYLYMDFFASSNFAYPTPALPPFSVLYNFRNTMQVARGGINIKLSGLGLGL